MVVHTVLAQRAGFSLDWGSTRKDDYLHALTQELDDPSAGHLDAYLRPLIRPAIAGEALINQIARTPGLDGSSPENAVLGKTSDPDVQQRYRQQAIKRARK